MALLTILSQIPLKTFIDSMNMYTHLQYKYNLKKIESLQSTDFLNVIQV